MYIWMGGWGCHRLTCSKSVLISQFGAYGTHTELILHGFFKGTYTSLWSPKCNIKTGQQQINSSSVYMGARNLGVRLFTSELKAQAAWLQPERWDISASRPSASTSLPNRATRTTRRCWEPAEIFKNWHQIWKHEMVSRPSHDQAHETWTRSYKKFQHRIWLYVVILTKLEKLTLVTLIGQFQPSVKVYAGILFIGSGPGFETRQMFKGVSSLYTSSYFWRSL